MTCRKAIITIAGWGTGRLPITKTIEKCMLPVGNRPVIDYIVQDCLAAGVNELIFVVGEDSTQVEQYFRSNIKLNDYLRRNGKESLLPLVAPLKGVKLHFVTQPSHGKYGTAVPVALAADYVQPGESVVIPGGDDFFYNADNSSEIARLIEGIGSGQNGLLAAVLTKDDQITGRYGLIEEDADHNLIRIVERPPVIPNPFLKNVSKYVLSYDMIQAIKRYVATDKPEGEYYIFAPFEEELKRGVRIKVVHAKGQYLDSGSLAAWHHANTVVIRDIDKK